MTAVTPAVPIEQRDSELLAAIVGACVLAPADLDRILVAVEKLGDDDAIEAATQLRRVKRLVQAVADARAEINARTQ